MIKKKFVISFLIASLILVITTVSFIRGYFEKPEFFVYDTKAKLFRSDKTPPKNIKLILVDDASLKALEGVAGRWPWPRAIWADLLEFLSMGGARAVLFDIMFTERSSQQDSADDLALAEATRVSNNVYHSMVINRWAEDDDRKENTQLGQPMPPDFVSKFSVKHVTGSVAIRPDTLNNDFALPIDPLLAVSRGVAVVEFSPDSDGVLRRTSAAPGISGKIFSRARSCPVH